MTAAPVVRLDSIAEVRLGRQRSPKDHDGPQMRPYVRAANVGWSGLLLSDVKSMNFNDDEMETYRLQPGDLLLNETSGSPKEVGKPAIWDGEIANCAFQNTLLRVRPRAADPRYLLQFFKQQAATGAFAEKSRGVGIHHLGREALASWPVPYVPIEEQRQIAAVLDYAGDLRGKRRAFLVLFVSLTEAIFLEMFGEPVSNPRGWDCVRFGELLERIDSGKSPVCLGRPAEDDEWGVLKLGAVTWGEYDDDENKALPVEIAPEPRYEVHDGDLLFARKNTSELVGACAFVHETRPRLLLSDLVFRLVPRPRAPVVPQYLHCLLSMPRKRRQVQTLAGGSAGSMPNISKERLLGAVIELPPMDLQREFARRLRAARGVLQRARSSADLLDESFSSLQQLAFAGQL